MIFFSVFFTVAHTHPLIIFVEYENDFIIVCSNITFIVIGYICPRKRGTSTLNYAIELHIQLPPPIYFSSIAPFSIREINIISKYSAQIRQKVIRSFELYSTSMYYITQHTIWIQFWKQKDSHQNQLLTYTQTFLHFHFRSK